MVNYFATFFLISSFPHFQSANDTMPFFSYLVKLGQKVNQLDRSKRNMWTYKRKCHAWTTQTSKKWYQLNTYISTSSKSLDKMIGFPCFNIFQLTCFNFFFSSFWNILTIGEAVGPSQNAWEHEFQFLWSSLNLMF